jgi:ribosomal protein L7/L12
MASTTLSNEEILEAIGNKTVLELADLIEAFKSKFNVTPIRDLRQLNPTSVRHNERS